MDFTLIPSVNQKIPKSPSMIQKAGLRRALILALSFSLIALSPLQTARAERDPITDQNDLNDFNSLQQLQNKGKTEEAQAIAQRLVKKYPKNGTAWRWLAQCLFFSLGHSAKEAQFYAERALSLSPDDSKAYQLLADIENENGHFAKAITYATKGLEQKDVDYRNYRSRSSSYTNLHNYEAALSDYSKYLDNVPRLAITRRNRLSKATLCVSAGHLQEALDIYDKLQKEQYGDTVPPLQAEILLKMHKDAEALGVLNELLKRVPNDELGYVARAKILEKLGRLADAAKDYSSAIAIDALPSFYSSRAAVYEKMGQKDKAAADRKSASTAVPF